MSVETSTSLGETTLVDQVKDWAVPVVGTAWILYIGVTCVGSIVSTVVALGLFVAAMAVAYRVEQSKIPPVVGALALGTAGLGGIGILCSQGEPLVEELLYVLIAGVAVTLHCDRQMLQ